MTAPTDARPRHRRLSPADWIRLQDYFLDFDLWMSDYPRREYRAIARSLRAEVRAAAAQAGMRQALRDLGSPRRLAADYLNQIAGQRPRWMSGTLAAFLALGLPFLVLFLYGAGALGSLLSSGHGRAELTFLGATLAPSVSPTRLGTEVSLGPVWWLWIALLTAITFVVASRAWRVAARPHG